MCRKLLLHIWQRNFFSFSHFVGPFSGSGWISFTSPLIASPFILTTTPKKTTFNYDYTILNYYSNFCLLLVTNAFKAIFFHWNWQKSLLNNKQKQNKFAWCFFHSIVVHVECLFFYLCHVKCQIDGMANSQ